NRDIKMLEDLIVAAQHDAVSNMQQLIQEKAGPMFSGMNIPGFN
ncbi:MAG: YbaB/EbfC family nucleoid-associated protein, partial [Treponema sp.]|nr:YbaB/EbfC family nucleoid-associated protein [Treponema sp.]